jgi:hypothetical protein
VCLGKRTGITGLAIFAKGHIHNDYIDGLAEFNGSATFFTEVLNMQPEDVCTKFQQWVCNRKMGKHLLPSSSRQITDLDFMLELDTPDNLQTAQNDCAVSIKKGLRKSTMIATSRYLTDDA